MNPKDVVLSFWNAMRTNDFHAASDWLSEDFECLWPQSSELIIGRANFAAINSNYPSHGPWTFTINSIIAEGSHVVTDVSVSDGVQTGRAITFHLVDGTSIRRQTEFWPDRFDALAWRSMWVQRTPEAPEGSPP